MNEEYVRENKIQDKSEEEKRMELLINIIKTKKDLDDSNNNFEYAENELIDYYTYQIKANKTKLDYLIKKAQSKGIILDCINELEIRKIM
ncbi:MAG: DUF2508 family protein [Clostridia bacterium]|jgi:hypothetical protein|nr:putative uncharacterized protein [Clostridium sp. CAG:798]HBJ12647.1 DUF2508 domain-containing protein [Clostridiales bacterium]